MKLCKWSVESVDKEMSASIAQEYELPTILSVLLQQRSSGDREKLESFIYDEGFLESPFEIIDMDKAVDRIIRAIDNFERIAVFGDYDADGVSSTAILFSYLQSLGADVMYYVPQREGEGYGMNIPSIEYLFNYEVKLIVTVDNGISSHKEVDFANEKGMEVIITDHHRPMQTLPNAYAVVNPHREDCTSLFKDYCGAGIALKLVSAIAMDYNSDDESWESYCDLAAIGTIGDMVSLTGENRVIVKKGMELLEDSDRLAIKALLEKSGISQMDSSTLAFSFVPRINAAGRMGSPERAVKLLIAQDEEEALIYAEDMCKDNEERKSIEADILEQAIAKIESDETNKYQRVLVVSGEKWHEGVVGIVASKIMEKYGKPCIIISYGDEEGKGSGRSFGDFSLFEAVNSCASLLIKYGGHHMAVGVTIKKENIDEFSKKVNDFARENFDFMPTPVVKLDLKIQPTYLNIDVPKSLSLLKPFGRGNELPVFGVYSMKLQKIAVVGAQKNHLRLQFSRDNVTLSCMLFFCLEEDFAFDVGDTLDLAVTLDVNLFKGQEYLSVIIKEMKLSDIDNDYQIHAFALYEKMKRNEVLTKVQAEEILPSRDEIADVYRYLRASKKSNYSFMGILGKLPVSKVNLGKLLVSLNALSQASLISVSENKSISIEILPSKGKVDLNETEVLKKLNSMIAG